MRRWKAAVWLMFLISLLLTACNTSTQSLAEEKALLSDEEVLSRLSERYDGTEFAILEKLNGSDYKREDRPKVQLYKVAPAGVQEQAFWVLSAVEQRTPDFSPSYYTHIVKDTYALDCFLNQFDSFLQENNISGFFRSRNIKVNMLEYLSRFHSQEGHFIVSVTQENADKIVAQIFDFIDNFYAEYPYQDRLDEVGIAVYFYDGANSVQDGEDPQGMYIEHERVLYERTYFYPFDNGIKYNDEKSVLQAINELFYGIKSE